MGYVSVWDQVINGEDNSHQQPKKEPKAVGESAKFDWGIQDISSISN